MNVDAQIIALESDLMQKETGSKEWKESMELLNKMYSIKLEEAKLQTAADAEEVKQAAEDRRFRLSIIKDISIGLGSVGLAAFLNGMFQLKCIDEVSEYEKSDSYTGYKKTFLPKGGKVTK